MSDCSEILFFEELDSTNLYLKQNYQHLADNTLVIAGMQSAGRGRLGRKWVSPANCNIYASLLVKNVHDLNLVGAIVGLAGLATVKEFAPELKAYIKWPNDIYVGKAKLAGILSESCELKQGKITAVACGIGININSAEDDFKSINQAATSLFCETKIKFNLDFFRKRLAFFTNRYYIMYLNNYSLFFREWVTANKLIGQELSLIGADGVTHFGKAIAIAPDGGLVLREKKLVADYSAVELNFSSSASKNSPIVSEAGQISKKYGDSKSLEGIDVGEDGLQKIGMPMVGSEKYDSNGRGEVNSQEVTLLEEDSVENIYYCGDVSVDKSSIDFDKLF